MDHGAATQWHRAIAASRQAHPHAQLPMPSRTRARAGHHIRHPIRAVGGDLQAETRREMKGRLRMSWAPAGHSGQLLRLLSTHQLSYLDPWRNTMRRWMRWTRTRFTYRRKRRTGELCVPHMGVWAGQ